MGGCSQLFYVKKVRGLVVPNVPNSEEYFWVVNSKYFWVVGTPFNPRELRSKRMFPEDMRHLVHLLGFWNMCQYFSGMPSDPPLKV